MGNLNYKRSRKREYYVFHKLEEDGWFPIRASGSHGVADIIGIRPNAKKCADPNHYEVIFVQVKVSEKFKIENQEVKVVKTKHFPVNVNFSSFPVKSKKHYALLRKTKTKKRTLLSSKRSRTKRVGLKQNKLRGKKKAVSR